MAIYPRGSYAHEDFEDILVESRCEETPRTGIRHRTLLAGGRGMDREPGCIREIQNFIGRGSYIEHAVFVSPAPKRVLGALEDWAASLQREEKDMLVLLSVLKAQFELIHRFATATLRLHTRRMQTMC